MLISRARLLKKDAEFGGETREGLTYPPTSSPYPVQ